MVKEQLKVLVIEDNPNCSELLEFLLKNEFDLTFTTTLKAGLAALDAGQFAAVILDLGLVNGHKNRVLDQVNEKRGAAATVVFTGDMNPATSDQMRNMGADQFAVKGRDDKDLVKIVHMAIQYRQKRKS